MTLSSLLCIASLTLVDSEMEIEYYEIVPIEEPKEEPKDYIPAQIAEWEKDRMKGYPAAWLVIRAQDIFKQILEDYP